MVLVGKRKKTFVVQGDLVAFGVFDRRVVPFDLPIQMIVLPSPWGRNKSSAESYAKVERSRNLMRHAVALPGGEAT